MRLMSFALTSAQVLEQTKTVTRRVGWKHAKPGDVVQPILKGQGLKKGESVTKLGGPIQFVHVTREWMSDFRQRPDAQEECAREGFPEMTPEQFYTFFRSTHPDRSADDLQVTRIEFCYVDRTT